MEWLLSHSENGSAFMTSVLFYVLKTNFFNSLTSYYRLILPKNKELALLCLSNLQIPKHFQKRKARRCFPCNVISSSWQWFNMGNLSWFHVETKRTINFILTISFMLHGNHFINKFVNFSGRWCSLLLLVCQLCPIWVIYEFPCRNFIKTINQQRIFRPWFKEETPNTIEKVINATNNTINFITFSLFFPLSLLMSPFYFVIIHFPLSMVINIAWQ